MIKLTYTDELGMEALYNLDDWDAVLNVAQMLSNAPIDLDYVYYEDGTDIGVFSLQTFTRC